MTFGFVAWLETHLDGVGDICKSQELQIRDQDLLWGFPGGSVVKNLPVQESWFKPWSAKIPHAAQQLSPCAKRSHCSKPVHDNLRVALAHCKWRKALTATKIQHSQKLTN